MHPRFKDLIDYASDKYDVVIIDTPPILAVTDPSIIASYAGATLLVARFGMTHIKELEIAQNRFKQNGIDIKGVIINAIQKSKGNAYNYKQYYSYEYT